MLSPVRFTDLASPPPPQQQQHQSIAVCVILLSVTEYMQSVYSDFFVL